MSALNIQAQALPVLVLISATTIAGILLKGPGFLVISLGMAVFGFIVRYLHIRLRGDPGDATTFTLYAVGVPYCVASSNLLGWVVTGSLLGLTLLTAVVMCVLQRRRGQ